MKKILTAAALVISTLTVPVAVAAPASARCAPPAEEVIYSFKDKSFTYYPTNVASDWVSLRNGGQINYTKTKTMEVNASATATVQTEANAIFAKASASLGVTVGGSKSWTQQWSYTANVPADTKHKYRLHAYHYSANFSVMKKVFNGAPGVCNYQNKWKSWQRVTHAPAKASRNVWRVDKVAA